MGPDFYGQLAKFEELVASANQKKKFLQAQINNALSEIAKAKSEIQSIDNALMSIKRGGQEKYRKAFTNAMSYAIIKILETKGKPMSADAIQAELKRQKKLKVTFTHQLSKYKRDGILIVDKNGLYDLPKKLGITGREPELKTKK